MHRKFESLVGVLMILVIIAVSGHLLGWWNLALLLNITAAGPQFSVERQRMTYCDAEGSPCDAPESFVFSPGEDVCIAWTEVNRESVRLAIYIYNEQEERVYAYIEPAVRTTRQTRTCRLQPIGQLPEPGQYQTEWVIFGKAYGQPIDWSIVTPTPTSH